MACGAVVSSVARSTNTFSVTTRLKVTPLRAPSWASREILSTNLDDLDLTAIVGKLFQEIAVRVSPQDAEDVLMTHVATIARRIDGKLLETVTWTLQRHSSRQPLHAVQPKVPRSLVDEDGEGVRGHQEGWTQTALRQ